MKLIFALFPSTLIGTLPVALALANGGAITAPQAALLAVAAAALSFGFMLIISHYSRINSPVEAQANKALTGAVIEYARGLAVVKSFGKDGAAMATVTKAIDDSRKIHQKIEWAMFRQRSAFAGSFL